MLILSGAFKELEAGNKTDHPVEEKEVMKQILKLNCMKELTSRLGNLFGILSMDLKRHRAVLDTERISKTGKPA